jgi:hypothetical protein
MIFKCSHSIGLVKWNSSFKNRVFQMIPVALAEPSHIIFLEHVWERVSTCVLKKLEFFFC